MFAQSLLDKNQDRKPRKCFAQSFLDKNLFYKQSKCCFLCSRHKNLPSIRCKKQLQLLHSCQQSKLFVNLKNRHNQSRKTSKNSVPQLKHKSLTDTLYNLRLLLLRSCQQSKLMLLRFHYRTNLQDKTYKMICLYLCKNLLRKPRK